MPSLIYRSRWQLSFAVAGLAVIILVVVLAGRNGGGNSTVASADGRSSGALVVEGDGYSFTPTTCFVGNNTFVAAGRGEGNGEDYWVNATPSGVDITFGVSDQSSIVAEKSRWFTQSTIDWTSDDGVVTADVEMVENSRPNGSPFDAALELLCRSD